MNYFSFYELPFSFFLDSTTLRSKFLLLSRKYHPDYYINASVATQNEVLQLATFNNLAYKTLSDFDLCMKYILQQKGFLLEEEKYQLPQAFLFEMMELNELLESVEQDGSKKNEIETQIQKIKSDFDQEIISILETYKEETASATFYEKVKDYYFKKKYLLRIQEQLDKFVLP